MPASGPSRSRETRSQSPFDLVTEFAAFLAARNRERGPTSRTGRRGRRRKNAPDVGIPVPAAESRPVWDRTWRQLWFGGEVIWAFARRAPRQFPVLDALERVGWGAAGARNPFRESLSRALARRRLHETVTNMNRHLRRFGLALREDGERVWWERVPVGE